MRQRERGLDAESMGWRRDNMQLWRLHNETSVPFVGESQGVWKLITTIKLGRYDHSCVTTATVFWLLWRIEQMWLIAILTCGRLLPSLPIYSLYIILAQYGLLTKFELSDKLYMQDKTYTALARTCQHNAPARRGDYHDHHRHENHRH